MVGRWKPESRLLRGCSVQPKLASRPKSIRTRSRVFLIAPLAAESPQENRFAYGELAAGRMFVESDPIGLQGGINTYSYARLNPISWIDPRGLASCPGGEWSQDFGDAGISAAFGGYISKGRVNYTCRSNPSIKCSAGVVCIGGGAILGGGIGWNLYGSVVGAPDSSSLAGWSGWQVTGNVGIIGLQAPPGGGVSVSAGIGGGAGIAAIKCYTYSMICTSGCGR